MLELLDNIDDLKIATKVTIDADKILSFQNTIAKPFVANLKANITSRFASPLLLLYQHCLYSTHGKFQNNIQYHCPLTEKSLLGS